MTRTALDTLDPPRSLAPYPRSTGGAPLRAMRPASPVAALGLAVSYLMTKPAFARLSFGAWSRVLVGQINRGDYRIVVDPAGRVVGFLGWVRTDEATAEAWLDAPAASDGTSADDCIVFNAWAAEGPAAQDVVLGLARAAVRGSRLIYARRSYDDGTVRPVRLRATAFAATRRFG